MARKSKLEQLSERANEHFVGPQWILDGAGPARWGYGVITPNKIRWLGRTLSDVEAVVRRLER